MRSCIMPGLPTHLHVMRELNVNTAHPQYRHLIPAPVDRTSASDWLFKHPWIICRENKPNSTMTHVDLESKLRSVLRSSIHPCQENWLAFGCAVVYYARVVLAFSGGIECRHCTSPPPTRYGYRGGAGCSMKPLFMRNENPHFSCVLS